MAALQSTPHHHAEARRLGTSRGSSASRDLWRDRRRCCRSSTSSRDRLAPELLAAGRPKDWGRQLDAATLLAETATSNRGMVVPVQSLRDGKPSIVCWTALVHAVFRRSCETKRTRSATNSSSNRRAASTTSSRPTPRASIGTATPRRTGGPAESDDPCSVCESTSTLRCWSSLPGGRGNHGIDQRIPARSARMKMVVHEDNGPSVKRSTDGRWLDSGSRRRSFRTMSPDR